MCKKMEKAMPVGSEWSVYHARNDVDMGYRKVTKHMSGKFQLERVGGVSYLDRHSADQVETCEDGSVKFYWPDNTGMKPGKLILVYTPWKGGA